MSQNVISLFKDHPEPARAPVLAPAPTAKPQRRLRPVAAVRTAVTHDLTKSAARAAARHGLYVAGGGRIVARRAWESRTTARHERFQRAAEAAGNTELAAEWADRAHQFREARHKRRMDLLTAPQRVAKGALIGTGTVAGGLLGLGALLAIAEKDWGMVIAPTVAVIDAVRWAVAIGVLVWGIGVWLAPWALLIGLWAVGAQQKAAPAWAMPAAGRGNDGAPITPSIVVLAMRDLGIPALRKAITDMGDAGAAMLSAITLAGCGVEVDVTLPTGVSTEEVMARRRKLAENLNRHEHEVYVTVAPSARTVRLWIADSGALDEPIPASPLVYDETLTANYKTGRAPWGQDLRGDAVLVSLYQKMLLVTGLSNQGKTAALRALALWLALDKNVEFWIGDLKGIGDWRMFLGLATVLIEGPTDDHVISVTEMVEGAFGEMQRRLLSGETDFPPLVVIVDEAQVAYGCGAKGEDGRPYGGAKATSRYFMAVKGIHDQGRAVNVTIWEGTQDPTDQNLPKRSREGNHIRASLVLGTESQAKMALGDAPVDAGAAPHKLRQGLDKGQLVVAGEGIDRPAGQVSTNVRTHYIDGDQAEAIADRAKALRNPVDTAAAVDDSEPIDALIDIGAVLGSEERVRTQEVLQRLAARNAYYREWTFADLRQVLEDAGAPPKKTDGGRMFVIRERLEGALAARGEALVD